MKLIPSKDKDYWVLGTQFLQNYYSIFDMGHKKVGFVGLTRSIQNEKITTREWKAFFAIVGIILTITAAAIIVDNHRRAQSTKLAYVDPFTPS